MSRQRTGGGGGEGGEGTDDYTVQQENELEALASIFGDDFQDLRTKDPWKVTSARAASGMRCVA